MDKVKYRIKQSSPDSKFNVLIYYDSLFTFRIFHDQLFDTVKEADEFIEWYRKSRGIVKEGII